MVDRSDIANAITVYRYSNTATFGSGLGPRVVQTLDDLWRRNEIGLVDLGADHLHGNWRSARPGFDLKINTSYINSVPDEFKLAALALVLSHEACHATLNYPNRHLLEELGARQHAVLFFRELAGSGVFNEAADVPGGRGPRVVRVPRTGVFRSYERQSRALARDRLVDFMLKVDTYQKDRYVHPDFIRGAVGFWGGLRNRRALTKGVYARKLARSWVQGTQDAGLLLTVLESVDTRADWDEIIDAIPWSGAGDAEVTLNTLRLALDEAAARSRPWGARVARLQERWRMNLTDDPPPRAPRR